MKTPVTEMLRGEHPIFAFSHCRDVVAAVTGAGGFGVLGAVAHTPDQLEADLAWIDEQVHGLPYGVDLLMPRKFVGADSGGMDRASLRDMIPPEHRAFLDDLLDRYGIPPQEAKPPAPAKAPGQQRAGLQVDPKSMAPLIDVAFRHPIKLLASALGSPPEWLVQDAHQRGIKVAALAGAVKHARAHAAVGVDFVIAQGTEAGGHTGEVSTLVLVPEVVDAVAPMPVLAAGGIATGRQMAAALALGASGVWCGSVWLTTEEAETAPAVKEKMLAATSRDTIRSRSRTGKPARQLRSAWTQEWEGPGSPGPLPMPLQLVVAEEAMRHIDKLAETGHPGARELANYFVGQCVGLMNTVKPARQVVYDMVEEFADALERLNQIAATD